ncbi:MAG: hypothetical protein AMXMBFR22_19060 [Phycisphaerae bacterium]
MRRSKGTLYRPVTTRTVGGRKVKRKAAFYWARYVDADGGRCCHALTLPDGGRVTDKDVARSVLDAILKRVERESAGLVDRTLEAARTPMRVVLADFIRHLRRKGTGRAYTRQALASIKWMIDHAAMERLADFREERIDKALGKLADAGRSVKTVNEYRGICFALARWAMTTARLLDRNPVEAVPRRKARGESDIVKVRRALTVEEAGRLLNVAGTRRAYYAVALWSGLRWGEIAALEWRDADLTSDRPAIRLRAEATKAKRADVLPLHSDLADVFGRLRQAVPFAKPTDRVFTRPPTLRTFKLDLDRAGITWRKDDHDDGASIDRHALRTTFVSWLEAAGVSGTAKRLLARHAAVGVTERHYTDARLLDLWAEIRKLPPIPKAGTEAASVKATGTHGKASAPPRVRAQGAKGWIKPGTERVALPVALHNGIQGRGAAFIGTVGKSVTSMTPSENTGKNPCFSAENELGATGFEPASSWSQTRRSSRTELRPAQACNVRRRGREVKVRTWGVRSDVPRRGILNRRFRFRGVPGDKRSRRLKP